MSISVDLQYVKRATVRIYDDFSIVRVEDDGYSIVTLFFNCEDHALRAMAVCDAINGVK